jgi:hypothetical protein
MPKKSLVGDREKREIAIAYNSNPQAKAEAIQQIASQKCGRELGLSTVQRELAKLRKLHPRGSVNPLDDQWSLASLSKFPLDYEAIPFLLYVQSTYHHNVPNEVKTMAKERGLKPNYTMSIRLAIWISLILRIPDVRPKSSIEKPNLIVPSSNSKPVNNNINPALWNEWVDDIVTMGIYYSNFEIGCELAGIDPINSIEFDGTTIQHIKHNMSLHFKELADRKGRDAILQGQIELEDMIPKGLKNNALSRRKKK